MRIGNVFFERALPGELARDIPASYEIPQEDLASVRSFYRQTRARTGIEIPQLEHLLAAEPLDTRPAAALAERHATLSYPHDCNFGGLTLEIDEGVFSPDQTTASPFLLDTVRFKKGERVLDAFAGSGAFGVYAATKHAASVVAFDTSDKAATCAVKNAKLHGVDQRIDFRVGTAAQSVQPGETFDLIIANPPLLPGNPASAFEAAIFDPGLQATAEFIGIVATVLAPRGRCYLLTSDVMERSAYNINIDQLCQVAGLRTTIAAKLHRKYETYRVHLITHRRRSIVGKALAKIL